MTNRGALLWMAAALGLAARLAWLPTALWYDEAFSAWLATLPPERLIAATLGDVHPPLYYGLLWAVGRVFGYAEWALRLPSLLAGLALAGVVYKLGRALRPASPKMAVMATIITLLAPFQVYYSTEARSYATLSLCVALAALFLVRRRPWWAVPPSLIALYLHNTAPVFVGSVWLAGLIRERAVTDPGAKNVTARCLARHIWPALALAAGYLPGLIWAARQAGAVGQDYWIPPLTSPGRLLATLDDLLFFSPNNPFVLATAAVSSGLVLLIVADLVSARRAGQLPANTKFLATAAALPLGVLALVSVAWQPVLITRVMAPAAPFLYLIIAGAVARSRRRLLALGLLAGPVAACVLLAGALVEGTGRSPSDLDYRHFFGRYQPGDALYHANTATYVQWRYYRPDVPQYVWPQDTTLNGGLTTQTRAAMGMREADFESVACDHPRWWLIYFHNPVTLPGEIAYVDHMLAAYPHKKIKQIRADSVSGSWLVLIEPACGRQQSAKKP